jgi:hypothetical protein
MTGDQQIQRQVGDERKRMCGVQRQRGNQWEHVFQVVLADCGALGGGQVAPGQNANVVVCKQTQQFALDAESVLLERAHPRETFGDLLLRRATVDCRLRYAGGGLLFEAADALHEELVEVRAGNGQELDAFQERVPIAFGLSEDALVESQPGQLTVEVEAWIVEVAVVLRRRLGCRTRDR